MENPIKGAVSSSWRRLQAVVGVSLIVASQGACGGGSSPTGPTPTPTPTTAGPERKLILTVSFITSAVADTTGGYPFDASRVEVAVDKPGTIDVEIDWTNASNSIFIGMYPSQCLTAAFYAETCPEIGSETLVAKPATVQFGQVAAGRYDFWVGNLGNSAESGTYRIYLTS
jgi:hypothetical protein